MGLGGLVGGGDTDGGVLVAGTIEETALGEGGGGMGERERAMRAD